MGPSPTIPTSFVPKQPVKSAARFSKSGTNIFMVIALFMLGLSVVGAIGVYGYGQFLKGARAAKADQLAAAEASINATTVEEFIRSRDRFTASVALLDGHAVTSEFFNLLEQLTLVNVRFNTLSFDRLADGSGKVQMAGNAKSFNALAAQSAVFSGEKLIKRAIFSDIQVAQNGTVAFSLSADIDAKLLSFDPKEIPVPVETLELPPLPAAVPLMATGTPAATTTP